MSGLQRKSQASGRVKNFLKAGSQEMLNKNENSLSAENQYNIKQRRVIRPKMTKDDICFLSSKRTRAYCLKALVFSTVD